MTTDVERIVMRWTREVPATPGWYFLRQVKNYADSGTCLDRGEREVLVVKVFDNTFGRLIVKNTFVHENAEWAGPIQEPVDA